MQAAVAVRLRVCDVILEAVRDRTEHIVDHAEHAVTFGDGRHDHTDRVFVIDLVYALVMHIDLFIDAVDALDSAVDLRRRHKIQRTEALRDAGLDRLNELLALLLVVLKQIFDLLIGIRIKEVEGKVLKLLLHGGDAEAVRDRRIDIHRLKGGVVLLVQRTVLQCAHVVQTVRELDDHDADVLRHREQDLHDIFRLLLLLAEGRHLGQLCHAVHQHRDIVAEALFHIVQRRGGVLDHIVQQRRAERVGIHAELQQNIRDSDRMHDIRLTG